MVKHKLSDFMSDRFLLHRKNSLILDPIFCSQLYHATYRNFSLVVKKEVGKIWDNISFSNSTQARFRLKLVSLLLLATALLPQDIIAQAHEVVPPVVNASISSSFEPEKITNEVEITQTIDTGTYVPKPTVSPVKTNSSSVNTVSFTSKKPNPASSNLTKADIPGFSWPINGSITTKFSFVHPGIDMPQASGTPIKTIYSGVVIVSRVESGYGNTIIVDHQNGFKSRYAHLSKLQVKVGDSVTAGTTLGLVGATGWATGYHLHLEIYKDNTPIDPLKALP